MALEYKNIQPLDYYKKFFENKIRPDGRTLWQSRLTSINIGSISTADGSALVRLGNTCVICGIKAELASPRPSDPNKGYIVPNIDFPPLCSPRFRPGPPGEQAQVTSQLVLNILNSSNCINLEDLCIQEGKLAWVLYCDIICLNYDGTIVDSAIIAVVAAFRNLRLPEVTLDADTNQPKVNMKKLQLIKLNAQPTATTFALFDDNVILIDPTDDEERLANGTITIASVESGKMCGVHKPGGNGLSDTSFQACVVHAQKRGKLIRKLIDEAISACPNK